MTPSKVGSYKVKKPDKHGRYGGQKLSNGICGRSLKGLL